MIITVNKARIEGNVPAPSSKSYTLRGLMCAALARGQSQLVRPLMADDTEAALRVLGQIGVEINPVDDLWKIRQDGFLKPEKDLFCGDSAATLRFMTAICALVPSRCRLTAGASLSRRPVRILVDALKKWGVEVECQGDFAPVTVEGASLKGGTTELAGNISSQFVSALLLLAPFSPELCRIRLTTPLESRSYVQMTLECLGRFGIRIEHSEDLTEFEISPQAYSPARYVVEGDWSSASYLLALGAVAGEISVSQLSLQSLQGDKAILDILKQMGASVAEAGEFVTVRQSPLKGIKTDLNESIDLLPTVAVLAGLAEGTSELCGIQRARFKESNRIASVRDGLQRAGLKVIEETDKLIITGGKPHKASIDSQNDHRIAMAFSIMGAAAGGITLEGAECVSKTYPEYWNTLRKLGVKLDER